MAVPARGAGQPAQAAQVAGGCEAAEVPVAARWPAEAEEPWEEQAVGELPKLEPPAWAAAESRRRREEVVAARVAPAWPEAAEAESPLRPAYPLD